MQILLLPKYSRKAASTRCRYLQYIPYLESCGFKCTVSPLFNDEYLEKRFNVGRAGIVNIVLALVNRLTTIIFSFKYDVIILHCEAFPYLTPLLEKYLAFRKIKYIYDYDDAIFHNYDQHSNRLVRWLLKEKIAEVIAGAKGVIAGNKYLANYALKVNSSVEIIPTVVDLNRFPKQRVYRSDKTFTIGWIGSPSTTKYIEIAAEAISKVCSTGDCKLILIGACNVSLPGINIERRVWSEDDEVENMQGFDVGIMPLPDGPWERGKCGFKIIQYMACSLPVVASPVGVNSEIVESGRNGFLAKSKADWINALNTLRNDKELRQRMGDAGREKVEAQYCLQVTAPKLVAVLQKVINGNR
jgi:glycosyltransferase involved in cell wall biosynthesis